MCDDSLRALGLLSFSDLLVIEDFLIRSGSFGTGGLLPSYDSLVRRGLLTYHDSLVTGVFLRLLT